MKSVTRRALGHTRPAAHVTRVTPVTPDPFAVWATWLVGGGAAGAIFVGLLWGSTPTLVAAVIVGGAALQGLWRGAAEAGAIFVALILAALLAPPLGRGLENAFGSVAGTTGLTNRLVAMAAVGVAITIVGAYVLRRAGTRFLRARPALQRWNTPAGGVLGLGEGIVLALLVLWAPLALEPVARARLAASEWERARISAEDPAAPLGSPPAPGDRVAWRVTRWAEEIRGSTLGPLVQATNPVAGSEILELAEDFVLIAQDREAMDALMQSAVMKRVMELPGVVRAIEIARGDAALTERFEREGATPATIRAAMDSPYVLRALDEGAAAREIAPLADELKQAIRAARERVRTPRP